MADNPFAYDRFRGLTSMPVTPLEEHVDRTAYIRAFAPGIFGRLLQHADYRDGCDVEWVMHVAMEIAGQAYDDAGTVEWSNRKRREMEEADDD